MRRVYSKDREVVALLFHRSIVSHDMLKSSSSK
jgi:hypothetical protein